LETRTELIQDYVAEYSEGNWRGLSMPVAEFQRLANPDLAPEIKRLWNQTHSNEEIREFLLKLAWLGAIQDCAEIAFDALMDSSLQAHTRLLGLRTLGECRRTDLLRKAADDMLTDKSRWPDRIVCSGIGDLFPNVVSTAELEQLLRQTNEPRNTVGGFSWELYQLVGSIEPNSDAAVLLRDMIAKLVWEGRDPASPSHQPVSKYSYLTPALARLCIRQVGGDTIKPELVWPSVLANRFHGDATLGQEDVQRLQALFKDDSLVREETFWSELRIMEALVRKKELDRPFWIYYDGLMREVIPEDRPWLLRALKKRRPQYKRRMALHLLIDLWARQGRPKRELKALKEAVADDSGLLEELNNRTVPRPQTAEERKRGAEIERMEREHEERRKQRDAEQREIRKSWADWKAKAEADPTACFKGERAKNSMWVLLQWLQLSSQSNSRLACTHWYEIRRILGGVIADGFEAELKAYWRKTEAPVWSRRPPEEGTVGYFVHGALIVIE